jgi:hypothetical protein
MDLARVLLAWIRLINGFAALFVPASLLSRLGVDTEANPAALYMARMFGIRTVVLGFELWLTSGERGRAAVKQAVVIHALDTCAAFLAYRTGKVPDPMGRAIVGISAVNTVLAVLANR